VTRIKPIHNFLRQLIRENVKRVKNFNNNANIEGELQNFMQKTREFSAFLHLKYQKTIRVLMPAIDANVDIII
jgi:hypothetical protein